MNGMRKWYLFLMAATLMALALPSLAAAPKKSYNLEFLLPAFDEVLNRQNPFYDGDEQLVAPVAVQVILKNESPPPLSANSNFSSAQFKVTGLTLLGDVGCPNAQCSVDTSTGTVYVTNISPPVQATQTITISLYASSCVAVNDAKVENVTVYTGSQLSGDSFQPYAKTDSAFPMVLMLSTRKEATSTTPLLIEPTGISCGKINCNGAFPVEDSRPTGGCLIDSTDVKCVTTTRGIDKNGFCGGSVDYFVTNLLTTDKKAHIVWQTNPSAAFAYQLNVGSASSPTWQVAWLPATGDPVFVGAQQCRGVDLTAFPPVTLPLPAQYATLASAIKSNDKNIKITVTGTSLPNIGDPIVIGGERMNVTKINSNTWTVDRAQGGTAPAEHPLNAPVMSTPLPTLTSAQVPPNPSPQYLAGYRVGNQAQVCQASVSHDNGNGTWSAWFIDIGDGWVRIGQ